MPTTIRDAGAHGHGAARHAGPPIVRPVAFTRACGFTMIEVMVAVATIAIIAAVAMPNYVEYVTRSKIVEATANLSDMRVRLEQYFADNRTYPTTCAAYAAGTPPANTIYLPASSKYFTITCALTATTYTVTASGNSSYAMGSFRYTVDEGNNKRTTSLPTGWSGAGTSSTCWVIRRNGSC